MGGEFQWGGVSDSVVGYEVPELRLDGARHVRQLLDNSVRNLRP